MFLGRFRHDLIVFLCIRSSFSLFCALVLCSSGAAYVSDDLMSALFRCNLVLFAICVCLRFRKYIVLSAGLILLIVFVMCCVRSSLSVILSLSIVYFLCMLPAFHLLLLGFFRVT